MRVRKARIVWTPCARSRHADSQMCRCVRVTVSTARLVDCRTAASGGTAGRRLETVQLRAYECAVHVLSDCTDRQFEQRRDARGDSTMRLQMRHGAGRAAAATAPATATHRHWRRRSRPVVAVRTADGDGVGIVRVRVHVSVVATGGGGAHRGHGGDATSGCVCCCCVCRCDCDCDCCTPLFPSTAVGVAVCVAVAVGWQWARPARRKQRSEQRAASSERLTVSHAVPLHSHAATPRAQAEMQCTDDETKTRRHTHGDTDRRLIASGGSEQPKAEKKGRSATPTVQSQTIAANQSRTQTDRWRGVGGPTDVKTLRK